MISITLTGADGTARQLDATPKLIQQAVRSATLRTARLLEPRVAAGMAQDSGIARSSFRKFRIKGYRSGSDAGAVWIGYNPIKAAYLPGTLQQEDWGASAGKWLFPGAFVATMKSGHHSIWKRSPTRERTRTGRIKLEEQAVALPMAPATTRRVIAASGSLFVEVLSREIAKRIARDAGGKLA